MKKTLKKWSALLLAVLLVCMAVPSPVFAFERPEITTVDSWEELLNWYGGLSGEKTQNCGVKEDVVCQGDVVLGPTLCRVDITFLKGLRIPAGASLTIDNANLVPMAGLLGITVEAGGTLRVKNWNALTQEALLAQAVWVKKGGIFILENGLTLPAGVVLNENQETESSPQPPAPSETPDPDAPPTLQGEMLWVNAERGVYVMLTLPYVDESITRTVAVERSGDGLTWQREHLFQWNTDMQGFISGQTLEADTLLSKNSIHQSKTFFEYMAPLTGQGFWLRVVLENKEGGRTISDAVWLDELPVGSYPPQNDYENFDGNRGGGGQGESDRVEQQQPPQPPAPTEAPAPIATPRPVTQAVQTARPRPADTATPLPTASPAPSAASTAPPPVTSQPLALEAQGQSPSESQAAASKKQGGGDMVWLAAGATLLLCAGVGILLHKKRP